VSISRFLMVCIGGALGSGARYLFSTAANRLFGNFPFGTLGVNVIGSFLISVTMVLALERTAITESTRLFLVTGILGGFTTYSSFNYETLHLAQSGRLSSAILNLGLTVVCCLASGLLGFWAARAAG
jgi:CrcB protein